MLQKPRWQQLCLAVVFFLLPLYPELFVFIIATLGVVQVVLRRHWVIPGWIILSSISLLIISQAIGPRYFVELNPQIQSVQSSKNLIHWREQYTWSGYEPTTFMGPPGGVSNGLVHLTRVHPTNFKKYTALLAPSFSLQQVKSGESLTFSFYMRFSGERPKFWVGFWVKRSAVYPVQPEFVLISQDLYRVKATFVPSQDEQLERIALEHLGGNWSEVGLGAAQLWPGVELLPFSLNAQPPPATASVVNWTAQFIIGFLLLYGCWFLLTKIKPNYLLPSIALGLFAHTVIALTQYLIGNAHLENRVVGLTLHPNILGHLAVACAGLLIVFGGWRWGLLGLLFAITTTGLTGSRAALIGCLMLLVWLIVLLPRAVRWASLVVVPLGLMLLLMQPDWLGRLVNVADISFFTTQARLQTWHIALEAFREHPISGVGLNNFLVYYLNHRPLYAVEAAIHHAHNIILHFAAGGGALGLMSLAVVIGWSVYSTMKTQNKNPLALLAILLLLNLLDFTFFTAGLYSVFWLMVAVRYGLVQESGGLRVQR